MIHQTFPTADLPERLSDNVRRLRALNPDWDYCFWDDTAIAHFILQHYGRKMLRLFNRINPHYGAARADVFRYLALYRLGGVYLDIKSAADKPLEEVIRPDDSFILAQWRNGIGEAYEGWGLHQELRDIPRGEYQQWHIMVAPEHPLLCAVIARVLLNLKTYAYEAVGAGRLGVLRLTGPIAYTRAIYPLLSVNPHRTVSNETALGLRYSIFEDDGRQNHKQIFRTHYANLKTPIVKRAFPRNLINHFFYVAKNL